MPGATSDSGAALNARAAQLARKMLRDASVLRIGVSEGECGETLIDCGVGQVGSIAAGLRLADICLAGLAEVRIVPSLPGLHLPWSVLVRTSSPVLACLASQYAGWSVQSDDEGNSTPVLGSGPARALARREHLFEEIEWDERADEAVLVLESERVPSPAILRRVADECGVAPDRLTMLFARTGSLAGCVQVAARAAECAVQKAKLTGFPLGYLLEATAVAPLCPPHPDSAVALGQVNDAIIYGSDVHLVVSGPATAAKELAEALPSQTAREYGSSFAEIFAKHGGQFHEMDPAFFSPARVSVASLSSGETFRAGAIAGDKLARFVA